MKFCATTLLGFFIHTSIAIECTSGTAEPVEQLNKYGSGGGDVSIPTQAHDLIGAGVDPPFRARSLLTPRDGSLKCNANEMCLSLAGAAFCYEVITGDFRDGDGTTGNALSGNYQLADGQKGNLYTGPYPKPTANGKASLIVDDVMSTATSETILLTTNMPSQTEMISTVTLIQTTAMGSTENAAVQVGPGLIFQGVLAFEAVALWVGVM